MTRLIANKAFLPLLEYTTSLHPHKAGQWNSPLDAIRNADRKLVSHSGQTRTPHLGLDATNVVLNTWWHSLLMFLGMGPEYPTRDSPASLSGDDVRAMCVHKDAVRRRRGAARRQSTFRKALRLQRQSQSLHCPHHTSS